MNETRGTCSTQEEPRPRCRVLQARSVTVAAAGWRSTPRSDDGRTILRVASGTQTRRCDLHVWSGWRDSNPRPPAPKATTGVRAGSPTILVQRDPQRHGLRVSVSVRGLCDYWDVRVRSPDGEWMIDVIHLTLTGTHGDGEWLRVRHWGMHFADLRTVEQLAEVVDLATLEEALGGASHWLFGSWLLPLGASAKFWGERAIAHSILLATPFR
jgi:hypothetical protein